MEMTRALKWCAMTFAALITFGCEKEKGFLDDLKELHDSTVELKKSWDNDVKKPFNNLVEEFKKDNDFKTDLKEVDDAEKEFEKETKELEKVVEEFQKWQDGLNGF